MLAGTPAPEGECRRRVQTGEDGLRPRAPITQPAVECSEHLPTPGPERLAQCCRDCRYWRAPDIERISSADEGLCRVWSPRWSGAGPRYAFSVTRRDFYCGDGTSLSYVDPDDEDAWKKRGFGLYTCTIMRILIDQSGQNCHGSVFFTNLLTLG